MKRVVHVVSAMNCGGIEKFIIEMYDQLKDDIQFDFIYMNDENEKFYFDKKIIDNGGRIFYIGKLKGNRLFSFSRLFIKAIKNNGPYCALHVHSFYNCGLISFLAKIAGQKNVIVHSHTTADNKNDNSIKRKLYRYVSKKLIRIFSDVRLACGIEAGKALYDDNNFIVINNGIDIDKFLNVTEKDINLEKKKLKLYDSRIITHIGSFYDVKNHEYILKIASKLKNDNKNVKILFIGDGYLKEEIERKTKELNLEHIIIFVGLTDKIEKYLLLSDVFILPSKYEGFPVSLVEAQTAGLPCIVSNVIDHKVDLKINKFYFIGIDDSNIDSWCKHIMIDSPKTDLHDSISIIKELSMDSKSSSKKLLRYYCGDDYE